jgi:hemerythrin-like domain-containing protein
MDAIALIKADHKTVEALFKQFEQVKEAGDDARKKSVVDEISRELEAHADIEEEIFYPSVKAKAEEEGQELVDEAVEEHHLVKVTLGELASLPPSDEAFDAKVTVLIENVRHHVEEEEEEMLPQAEELLGADRLAELGQRMAERKQELLGQAGSSSGGEQTKEELYEQAKEQDIPGRSQMSKEELAREVGKG